MGDVMTTMDKINKLLRKRGIYGYQLTDLLGLSRGVYSQWNTGLSKPSQKNLRRIAEYFGVPYESLLPDDEEEKEKTPTQGEGLTGLDQELIRTILSLSESEKASLYAFLSTHKREV